MPREAVGDALREAGGIAGGTLAVLAPHPAGVMPCPGEGEEPSGELSPLPAQPQPSRSVCERWAGGHARLEKGQLRPVGRGGSALMGKPVIQRALLGGGGERGGKERLIKQRKVPDRKLPAGLEWCTHFAG